MNLRELYIVEINICSKLKTFPEECCLSVHPVIHVRVAVYNLRAVSLLLVNSNKDICTVLMYLSIYMKCISQFNILIHVQNYFLVRSTAGVKKNKLFINTIFK